MLILSLLSITVFVLLVFSLTKDTGKHTKYARHNTVKMPAKVMHKENHNLSTVKAA